MKHYYVRKVIGENQLQEISNLIEIANQNNSWVDGLITGGTKQVKNNLELSDLNSTKIINKNINIY